MMTWSIGLSTGACIHRPVVEMLDAFHNVGIRGVELGTRADHFDTASPEQVANVSARLRSLGMQAISIHAPFGPGCDLASPDPTQRKAAVAAVLAAARAIKHAGGSIVVVHPSDLERRGQDVAARLDDAAHGLSAIADDCRQQGLTLAVESPLPHLIGGHPDEFRTILGRLDTAVKVCLDTGHTSLGGFWDRFLEVSDGRLIHVHANDNHGTYDDHLPPGDGRIDWSHIVSSLKAASLNGWIMLELNCGSSDLTTYFRNAWRRADALRG